MRPRKLLTYDDGELVGLELSQTAHQAWSSGEYKSLTELTSALYQRYPDIPRSALFWLTYHVIHGDD